MKIEINSFNVKRIIISFLLINLLTLLYSFDYYEQGLNEFRQKKFTEAIPLFYQATQQENADPKAFTYLGLSYQYVGKHADAISTFIKGTSVAGADKVALFFNAGNVYFLQEMFKESEAMYTNAIQNNGTYAHAWLNRANSRVNLGLFEEAIKDYSQYLYLDPASWQKDAIKQMINVLNKEIEVVKNIKALEEAERLVFEAEKKEQEARYQKLLDSISASLQSVDGASVFSAGSEQVLEYEEEGQLD